MKMKDDVDLADRMANRARRTVRRAYDVELPKIRLLLNRIYRANRRVV